MHKLVEILRRKIKMNQKEIAIQCLKKLDIYKSYIKKFENETIPTFFERLAGFYLFNEPVVEDKVRRIEREYNVLVYAVTHEWFEFGECWSFLCVSGSAENLEDCITETSLPDTFYVYSYVWNQDDNNLSEFGDIIVKCGGGGIRRIG
jgi:hypothetical protein